MSFDPSMLLIEFRNYRYNGSEGTILGKCIYRHGCDVNISPGRSSVSGMYKRHGNIAQKGPREQGIARFGDSKETNRKESTNQLEGIILIVNCGKSITQGNMHIDPGNKCQFFLPASKV